MFKPAGFQRELQKGSPRFYGWRGGVGWGGGCLCYQLLKVIDQANSNSLGWMENALIYFWDVPISHGLSSYQTFNKWINPNFRGGTEILMALKMEVNRMIERWQTAGWKESTLRITAISCTFKMTLAVWKFSAMIFSSVILCLLIFLLACKGQTAFPAFCMWPSQMTAVSISLNQSVH